MAGPVITYECWGLTHPGRVRDSNEDAFLLQPEAGLWLVADGMGGHDAGEIASRGIVEQMATIGIPASASDQHARFLDRLQRANSKLREYSQRKGGAVVGSTIAALLIYEGEYRCPWLGDSRVYLLRHGQLSQLSRDHSEVQNMVEQGLLSREEARYWPHRNVITRAVGADDVLDVETVFGNVEGNDCFLLCSDGLTTHCDDDEIRDVAIGRRSQEICETLVEMALSRGGTDNVTVVAVQARTAEVTIALGSAFPWPDVAR